MDTLYGICAVVGIFFILVQLGMGFTDFDFHHGDIEHDSAFNLLSLRSITFGLATFGVLGKLHNPFFLALGLAIGVYLVTAWLSAKMKSLDSDGSLNLYECVGKTGKVYSTVGVSSTGKIQVSLRNEIIELPAKGVGQVLMPPTTVLVIDFDGTIATVQPLQKGD